MHISDLHRLSAVPIRTRCIGLTLEPLSVDHLEALERFGVDWPQDAASLALAVFVCAVPRDRLAWLLARPWAMRVAWWVWGKTAGEWDSSSELRVFHAYLSREISGPSVSAPFGASGGGARSNVPLSVYLRTLLCARLGASPETAGAVRVRDVLWQQAALAEMDGRGVVEAAPVDERVAEMEATLPPDDVILRAMGVA